MTSKKKANIILTIFIAINISLIVFFVWPLLTQIKTNSKEILSAKNNIATLGIQANEIENFGKNYSLYKPNLEKMEQLFVDFKDPIDFIEFLEKTAADSELTSKISLPPATKEENKTFIIFQFFSTGDPAKILEFSKKIENGPYLIEIENLTVRDLTERDAIKDSSEKVGATFLIKAFTK